MDTFYKQPGETLDYRFDFSDWAAGKTGVTALSVTLTATAGITLSSPVLSGWDVFFTASGGVTSTRYKITARLTTNTGLVREADCYIVVRER